MRLARHLSRYRLAYGIGVVAVAIVLALVNAQFTYWERLLRGPYEGIAVTNVANISEDSVLRLKDGYALAVSNSYARDGADDWPLVVLHNPDGTVRWARLLKPAEKAPAGGAIDSPFVRDVRLLKRKAAGQRIKVIFSCYWGNGGHENGIIYIDGGSLDFHSFAISW